jgi:hypothetical protein
MTEQVPFIDGTAHGRALAIAAVQRQLAEFEAADAAVAAGLARAVPRASPGGSSVFSLRLGDGELEALTRRAAALAVKPSVLARNLIRLGLERDYDDRLAGAVDRVASAVDELRAVVC